MCCGNICTLGPTSDDLHLWRLGSSGAQLFVHALGLAVHCPQQCLAWDRNEASLSGYTEEEQKAVEVTGVPPRSSHGPDGLRGDAESSCLQYYTFRIVLNSLLFVLVCQTPLRPHMATAQPPGGPATASLGPAGAAGSQHGGQSRTDGAMPPPGSSLLTCMPVTLTGDTPYLISADS